MKRWALSRVGWFVVMAATVCHAQTKPFDCSALRKIDPNESYKVDPANINSCMLLGWDAPKNWKRNGGKSAGISTGGARGFSYTSEAPETPPGKRGVNASVSRGVMNATCTFPPRIKGLKIEPGSCYDFLHNMLKDSKGKTSDAPIPPGVSATDPCPAESDNTAIFGVKQPLKGGATAQLCGAMLPATTYDLVLNRNPTNLIGTENGSYYMYVYNKTATGFSLVGNGPIALPKCLAAYQELETGGMWVKTVDLTAPTAQMITYNPGNQMISIRLQSRETMSADFVPGYDENAPVFSLVLPLDASGMPQVPALVDGQCVDQGSNIYALPDTNQQIGLVSATVPGCEGVTASPPFSSQFTCPDGTAPSQNHPAHDQNYKCLINGSWQLAGQDTLCSSSTTSASPDAGCDTMTLNPSGTFADTPCDGKLQYAVLDRPNLYYPPNTSATLLPIQGRSAFMAATVEGSALFMQSEATISLQRTAPALTLNDGGFIKMRDGSMLIMSPPAIIDAGKLTVTLPQGGELTTSGGTSLKSFENNASYTIPDNLVQLPLQIRVGRSVTLPAGYMIPSMPAMSADPSTPYIRLPLNAPPP